MEDDKDNYKNHDDTPDTADRETILMALDQISQTIEVMNGVVGRLRGYVEAQSVAQEADPRAALRSDRILH